MLLPWNLLMTEIIVTGLLVVLPLTTIVSFLAMRIAVAEKRGLVEPDGLVFFTSFIKLLVAAVMTGYFVTSFYCYPYGDETFDSLSSFNWLQQSWGFRCPAASFSEEVMWFRKILGEVPLVLLTRLIFLIIGLSIGEAFLPMALTGGIACGKSTVAKELICADESNSGWHTSIIDADAIGHEILLPTRVLEMHPPPPEFKKAKWTVQPHESVFHRVLAAFPPDEGRNVPNILSRQPQGQLIDRTKLGDIIFADASARRRLNGITHPQILKVMLKRIAQSIFEFRWRCSNLVFVDIPLLFESGKLVMLFAFVICVSTKNEALVLNRLKRRNPDWTIEHCRSRIASQMPVSEKAKRSDFVIRNDGTLSDLRNNVKRVRCEVMQRIQGLWGTPRLSRFVLLFVVLRIVLFGA